jgi:hypothetical protein
MRDTIEMAREAGFTPARDEWVFMDMLKAFEALARADEREACAKLCDEEQAKSYLSVFKTAARLIRARGETK